MVLDKLGSELAVGDYIFTDNQLWRIIRFTPKSVAVEKLNKSKFLNRKEKPRYFYPHNCIIIDEDKIILYILSKSK